MTEPQIDIDQAKIDALRYTKEIMGCYIRFYQACKHRLYDSHAPNAGSDQSAETERVKFQEGVLQNIHTFLTFDHPDQPSTAVRYEVLNNVIQPLKDMTVLGVFSPGNQMFQHPEVLIKEAYMLLDQTMKLDPSATPARKPRP